MRRYIPLLLLLLIQCCLAQVPTSSQYDAQVAVMQQKLGAIDRIINRVNRTHVVDGSEGAAIETNLDEYSTAALEAFKVSQSRMQDAATAKQAAEVTRVHRSWETLMEQHKTRIDGLISRIGTIDRDIRLGTVKASPALLQSLSPEELKQFREGLKPNVDQRYKQQLPTLFQGPISHLTDKEWETLSQCTSCTPFEPIKSTKLGNLPSNRGFDWSLTPKAHAAAGYTCYGICVATLGTACVQCVAAAVVGGVAAYEAMNSCKSKCCRCKWYKPWCCACKPLCVAAFLAYLA